MADRIAAGEISLGPSKGAWRTFRIARPALHSGAGTGLVWAAVLLRYNKVIDGGDHGRRAGSVDDAGCGPGTPASDGRGRGDPRRDGRQPLTDALTARLDALERGAGPAVPVR